MKKILSIVLLTAFLFPACDERLDEHWNNPNVYQPDPDEVVSGLFTHLQKTRFWLKDYGEWYWLLGGWDQNVVSIAQLTTYVPYTADYCTFWADDNYGNVEIFPSNANGNLPDRFNRFYTDMNNYSLIRDEVKLLEGAEYADNVVFLHLATVLKDIIALQTVDLFNSIPYQQSFLGSEAVFFTPYDDPLEIYQSVIEELQTIAGALPGVYDGMSELSRSTLTRQDLFFKGDVDKWVKFINSQILKAGVRISGVAADYAKPFIAEAVKNLPAEDYTFASPIVNPATEGSHGHSGIRQRAFYEAYHQLAIPDVIMLRLNRGTDYYEPTVDDPRLPVLAIGYSEDGKADKVEYYGVSGNWDRNRYLRSLTPDKALPIDSCRWNVTPQINPTDYVVGTSVGVNTMVKSCRWSYYNPITYVLSESPLYANSLAENDLLLAEVALKSLAATGKSAGAHINDAVTHSIDFWYMMNGVKNSAADMTDDTKKIVTPAKPDAAIITAYAATVQSEFEAAPGEEDKMEILMQQKYIHLNIHEPFECFAELRRTRHPKLEPITCEGNSTTIVNATCMVERIKLPTSERTNNYDEYAKIMADDLWGKPIFWVPQNKIDEKYFLPQALKAPLPE